MRTLEIASDRNPVQTSSSNRKKRWVVCLYITQKLRGSSSHTRIQDLQQCSIRIYFPSSRLYCPSCWILSQAGKLPSGSRFSSPQPQPVQTHAWQSLKRAVKKSGDILENSSVLLGIWWHCTSQGLFLNPHLSISFIIYFREEEGGREGQREISMWQKNINQLPSVPAPNGDQTHNRLCDLTRDQTCRLLVYRMILQPTGATWPGSHRPFWSERWPCDWH